MFYDSIVSLLNSFKSTKDIAKVSFYAVKTGLDGKDAILTFKNETEMMEAQAKEFLKAQKDPGNAIGEVAKKAGNVAFSPGVLRIAAAAGTTFAFLGAVPIGAVALGVTAGTTAYQMNRDTKFLRKAQSLKEQSEFLKQLLDTEEKLTELRSNQSSRSKDTALQVPSKAIDAANELCGQIQKEIEHHGNLTLAEKAKIIAKTVAENSGQIANLAVTGAMLHINPVAFSLAVVDKAISLAGHSKEGLSQAAELKELVLDNQKLLLKFQELDAQESKAPGKAEEPKYDNQELLEHLTNKRIKLVAMEMCLGLGEEYNNEKSFQIVEKRIKDIISNPELYAPQAREHKVTDLVDLTHYHEEYKKGATIRERHDDVSLPVHQEKEGKQANAVNYLIYDWYEWMKTQETLESETKWQSFKKLFKASFDRKETEELISGTIQLEELKVRTEHVNLKDSELKDGFRNDLIKELGLPVYIKQEHGDMKPPKSTLTGTKKEKDRKEIVELRDIEFKNPLKPKDIVLTSSLTSAESSEVQPSRPPKLSSSTALQTPEPTIDSSKSVKTRGQWVLSVERAESTEIKKTEKHPGPKTFVEKVGISKLNQSTEIGHS